VGGDSLLRLDFLNPKASQQAPQRLFNKKLEKNSQKVGGISKRNLVSQPKKKVLRMGSLPYCRLSQGMAKTGVQQGEKEISGR